MSLEQLVERKIALRSDSDELLPLWKTIWGAYQEGGRESVECALQEICNELARDEEEK
jgi:hypothetical protein